MEKKQKVNELEAVGFKINPKSFEEAREHCKVLANSNLVPKDFRGKPDDVMVAIQIGQEIGLKPLQSLQNVAVINGRPCVWGDAIVALVRSSGTLEYLEETFNDETKTATCKGKRKGETKEIVRTFSMADAQKAGLIQRAGSTGTWATYPKRMCGWRAKSWVIRDGWADFLKGISIKEEIEESLPIEAAPAAPAQESIMPKRKIAEAEVVETPEKKPETISTPTPAKELEEPLKVEKEEPKKVTKDIVEEGKHILTTILKVTMIRNSEPKKYNIHDEHNFVYYTFKEELAVKADESKNTKVRLFFEDKKGAYELVDILPANA